MMAGLRYWLALSLTVLIQYSSANESQKQDPEREVTEVPAAQRLMFNDQVHNLEYKKYLLQVLEALQQNEKLYDKLASNIIEMNFDKAAQLLTETDSHIRTRLDEVKRIELDRIVQIAGELNRRGHKETDVKEHVDKISVHVDTKNLHSFGTEDLRKLLAQSQIALQELDTVRRENFKVYEMHKRLEFEELINRLSPEEQEKVKQNVESHYNEHRRRPPIHIPASMQHLMEVWEERDRMAKESFNVRTFFHMHDLDGNGFMDEPEVKALLYKEAEEHYDPSKSDFDRKEVEEEVERMREYIYNTADLNKDHLISVDEFVENSKRHGIEDDHYWDAIEKSPIFTEEEYRRYEAQNRKEVIRMIDEGKIHLPITAVVTHEEEPVSSLAETLSKRVKGEFIMLYKEPHIGIDDYLSSHDLKTPDHYTSRYNRAS